MQVATGGAWQLASRIGSAVCRAAATAGYATFPDPRVRAGRALRLYVAAHTPAGLARSAALCERIVSLIDPQPVQPLPARPPPAGTTPGGKTAAEVGAGRGGKLVLVTGAAGSGKTWYVKHLCIKAQTQRLLTA